MPEVGDHVSKIWRLHPRVVFRDIDADGVQVIVHTHLHGPEYARVEYAGNRWLVCNLLELIRDGWGGILYVREELPHKVYQRIIRSRALEQGLTDNGIPTERNTHFHDIARKFDFLTRSQSHIIREAGAVLPLS